MHRSSEVTNILIAGLGGQGVLKASDIVAQAAFSLGYDVKKAEVHGMSQRGGSVASDVRFGPQVWSPMVPPGEADFLVVLDATQIEVNRPQLRPGGVLIEPAQIPAGTLSNARTLNVALLGLLSRHLPLSGEAWLDALRANLPERLHAANLDAFAKGQAAFSCPSS